MLLRSKRGATPPQRPNSDAPHGCCSAPAFRSYEFQRDSNVSSVASKLHTTFRCYKLQRESKFKLHTKRFAATNSLGFKCIECGLQTTKLSATSAQSSSAAMPEISAKTHMLQTAEPPHQPFAATNSNGIQMYRVWPQNFIPRFAATNSNGNQNSNFIPNVSLLRTPWDSNVSSVASKPPN